MIDHVTIVQEPKLSFEDARKICVKTIVTTADFSCIQLVYGFAGKLSFLLLMSRSHELSHDYQVMVRPTTSSLSWSRWTSLSSLLSTKPSLL